MSYQANFTTLLHKQPFQLPRLLKLCRIDYLSCFEQEENLTLNPGASQHWFIALGVLLTKFYLEEQVVLQHLSDIQDTLLKLNAHQQYMTDPTTIVGVTPAETSSVTLEYIQLRYQLINYVKLLVP